MKRVKVMLTAILVMAVVAAGLAFKTKVPLICAYAGNQALNCPRVQSDCVSSKTVATTISTQWARTIDCVAPLECPATTQCIQSRTLAVD